MELAKLKKYLDERCDKYFDGRYSPMKPILEMLLSKRKNRPQGYKIVGDRIYIQESK